MVEKYGLRPAGGCKYSAKGGLAFDQLETLISAGMTIAEIAEEVGRSKGTVRHWLSRYGLKTSGMVGRRPSAAVRAAKEREAYEAHLSCLHHGETRFVVDVRGYYRCAKCRSESVSRRRRRVKELLVREAGGACRLCGYSRCISALEFHHVVPADKQFGLASRGITQALATVRAEAEKCVLLCANCHAEVEAGITALGQPAAA